MTTDLSAIDHVILGVNDLERGIEEFERLTGVRAVYGGAHPGRGTQNALASLGETSYLEILAPNPAEGGKADWLGDLTGLDTLTPLGWAARGRDLEALRRHLAEQGLEVGEVTPGARDRPDGSHLAWETLGFPDSASALLPFFIAWKPGSVHPSVTSPAGCRLTGFALQDPEPEPLRAALGAAGLGVEVTPGKSGLRISLACPKGDVELR